MSDIISRLRVPALRGTLIAQEAADEIERLTKAHDWQYTMAGERLRKIEKLEAELASAIRCCDSYAEENQCISDERDALRADVNRLNTMLRDKGLGQGEIDAWAEAVEDAERYRWLRSTTKWVSGIDYGERIASEPEKWDAAIDAAMKGKDNGR